MNYEEIKEKLAHVWPMEPSEARAVLTAGSWANGEAVADNEREALEALVGSEEDDGDYEEIQQLADANDVACGRGVDSDGAYIRLWGFLADLQAIERQVQDRYLVEHADTGFYLRKRG